MAYTNYIKQMEMASPTNPATTITYGLQDVDHRNNTAIHFSGVDYVVASNKSGAWTYRKWNSGLYECWTSDYPVPAAVNNKVGNCYYGDGSQLNFPITFKELPSVVISMTQTTSTTSWASIVALSKTSCTPRVFRGASTDQDTYKCSVHVVGYWK